MIVKFTQLGPKQVWNLFRGLKHLLLTYTQLHSNLIADVDYRLFILLFIVGAQVLTLSVNNAAITDYGIFSAFYASSEYFAMFLNIHMLYYLWCAINGRYQSSI